MDLSQYAPRRELKESAFRKFEVDIARACGGTVTVDPGGMAATTYISRFRDAVLAYKRYGYTSDLIPPNYDLSNIRARERLDGKVDLTNESEDKIRHAVTRIIGPSLKASDREAVVQMLRTTYMGDNEYNGDAPDVCVSYASDEERDWLKGLRKQPEFWGGISGKAILFMCKDEPARQMVVFSR